MCRDDQYQSLLMLNLCSGASLVVPGEVDMLGNRDIGRAAVKSFRKFGFMQDTVSVQKFCIISNPTPTGIKIIKYIDIYTLENRPCRYHHENSFIL